MSLYKEFSTLLPYIQSIRKLKEYLSFDISFPNNWKLPKKYVQEDKVMEQESVIQNERLFSFVTQINEQDIEKVIENIKNIIKYNIELEEKEKLFQSKVEELKNIFQKQNITNLRDLQFEIKKNTIKLTTDDEEIKDIGLVSSGEE